MMRESRVSRCRPVQLAVALAAMAALQGCLVIGGTVVYRAIKSKKTGNTEIAEVRLDQSADTVYKAELAVLKDRGATIVKADPAEHRIEATQGGNRIVADADPAAAGGSQLVVTAQPLKGSIAPDGVAVDLEKDICESLGVDYKVLP